MRASTVFILALALLIAFVAVAAAKSFGLFDRKPPEPPPPPPPPIKLLAAKVNLYEGVTVTADQVYVREISPAEASQLEARHGKEWKDKVMRPLVTAAHLRISKQNLPADTILFKDQFADSQLPDSLSQTLEPNTRAVNVTVPKDKAVGGVLRVGEYVDVFLTTTVGIGDREEMRTACIARACKVIMKRNIIWPGMLAADPDDKPLHFTLQANLYRAALIEYSRSHGQLTLLPVPTPTKTAGTFSDPSNKEYATEDQRVDEMVRNARTIGLEDLVRIFQLPPPPPPVPPTQYVRIQHLAGVADAGSTVFPADGQRVFIPPQPDPANGTPRGNGAAPGGTQQAGYNFRLPSATGDPNCATCGTGQTPVYRPIRN